MKDLLTFLASCLFYFVLAYAIITILLAVGCTRPPVAHPFWPDAHAKFMDYAYGGQYRHLLRLRRQAYASCVVESMAGEDVRCGESPWLEAKP